MKVEISPGVLSKKEITVENPGENVSLFEVYLDDFSDWIKAKPESFVLEGGNSQKVILELKSRETGLFSTMISVVAKPLSERKFKANSGVKIPLEIRIAKKEKTALLAAVSENIKSLLTPGAFIFILDFILVLVLTGILLKKNKIAQDEKRN